MMRRPLHAAPLLLVLLLGACATQAPRPRASAAPPVARPAPIVTAPTPDSPTLPQANSGRGAYYQDDGPMEHTPVGLENTVDPIPMNEPLARAANRPYSVFGKVYTPITDPDAPFKQRGLATWYGKKFHGQRTSSGETYDMFKMSAAHPSLPIPSYARVTNLDNGRQVIVRINDRGPFHSDRVIDLSYTAALKLGVLSRGSSPIEVERLLPAEIARMAENRANQVAQPDASSTDAPRTARPVEAALSLDDWLAQRDPALRNAGSTAAGTLYLQVGAFALKANAEAVRARLQEKTAHSGHGAETEIVEEAHLYRLFLGPFASREAAQSMLPKLYALGLGTPRWVSRE